MGRAEGSDDLEALEEGDDALRAIALVHDDLTGGAGLSLLDRGDLLAAMMPLKDG